MGKNKKGGQLLELKDPTKLHIRDLGQIRTL